MNCGGKSCLIIKQSFDKEFFFLIFLSAREAEAIIERSVFSASYAKAIAEREQGKEDHRNRAYAKQGKHNRDERGSAKNPHFVRKQQNSNIYHETNKRTEQGQAPEPMEIELSPSLGSALIPPNLKGAINTPKRDQIRPIERQGRGAKS